MIAVEKNITTNEIRIREQIESFVKAFSTKNVDLMMSLFAPEMVSFDIIPPLQYEGSDVYRKVWSETFALFQDPINIDLRNLNIVFDKRVAFSHCFLRLQATMMNGQKKDYWERLTFCFQKIEDKWLIVHEHVSFPADLKTGTAVSDLKP